MPIVAGIEASPMQLTPEAESLYSEQLVAERNAWLDESLNPEGTLPMVTIADSTDPRQRGNFARTYTVTNEEGVEVGDFRLLTPNSRRADRGHKAQLNGINLEKGHGYGKATYLEILKSLPLNTGMCSAEQLSRGSKPIWDWLVASGVAVQTDPGQTNEATDNAAYSTATYETLF